MFLLSIDPGEEKAGCALFNVEPGPSGEANLITGFRPTVQELGAFIEDWYKEDNYQPLFIVYEDYRVYSHKLKEHRYSAVKTVACIGQIQYLINKYNIAHKKFMAGQWKGVVKDERLQREGFWRNYNATDNRHIRDATGLGVYAWRFAGIFNNNKRVITKKDRERLDAL